MTCVCVHMCVGAGQGEEADEVQDDEEEEESYMPPKTRRSVSADTGTGAAGCVCC